MNCGGVAAAREKSTWRHSTSQLNLPALDWSPEETVEVFCKRHRFLRLSPARCKFACILTKMCRERRHGTWWEYCEDRIPARMKKQSCSLPTSITLAWVRT